MLDFERPLLEMEEKIADLKKFSDREKIDVSGEISKLQQKALSIQQDIFAHLTPWQRVQLARHPDRPYSLDYIKRISEDFVELHGDHRGGDDPALIGGPARIDGWRVVFVGQQKGRNTRENLRRNFGSAHPEGYRQAYRLMKLAAKFQFPVIALIDTPGAYPGIGGEERGQALAIAENLKLMMELPTAIVVVVIGEGGSGGALGIGVGDRVLIMENAYYSVISPEGCAAILWKEKKEAPAAARALQLTPRELLKLDVVDEIIPEPPPGAHRDWEGAAGLLKSALINTLEELKKYSGRDLIRLRQGRYRKMGIYAEQ